MPNVLWYRGYSPPSSWDCSLPNCTAVSPPQLGCSQPGKSPPNCTAAYPSLHSWDAAGQKARAMTCKAPQYAYN